MDSLIPAIPFTSLSHKLPPPNVHLMEAYQATLCKDLIGNLALIQSCSAKVRLHIQTFTAKLATVESGF